MNLNRQLQGKTNSQPPPPVGGLLQRKCACGGTPGPSGECEACRKQRVDLQRKPTNAATSLSPSTLAPPCVYEVLNSPGQALDASTRGFMEPRFGRDFSRVRVHTDGRAAESALAVNARAYTVGQDVAFGAGQYAPETTEGRKLMAHELTHVVQQADGPDEPQALSVEPAHGASELEAEQTAEIVAHGGQVPPVSVGKNGSPLRRSLLGGIVGGVLGAVGGAALGFLAGGPIGAVAGGLAGLVGGTVIGDKVSTQKRALTTSEIAYAKDVFKDSIDYSVINITRDSLFAVGAPKTIGNTIHLKSDWGHFKGGTLELTEVGLLTLIHEMGHVWQYQNGGLAYIPQSLWAQFKAALGGGSRNLAYDWRAAHASHLPWEKWNPEQQAEAIEDYNKLLRKSKDGTATITELSELSSLLPYMEKVWARQGAPSFHSSDSQPSVSTGMEFPK